jgi:hypothetical protein
MMQCVVLSYNTSVVALSGYKSNPPFRLKDAAFGKGEGSMLKRWLWLNIPALFLSLASSLFGAGNSLPLQRLRSGQHLPITGKASCLATSTPNAQSLLIVLLDRSSSLAQTDPAEYSTSITRVLANLWPGRMAVILFSGTTQPLPQLGPVDLILPGARAHLQTQIEAQKNVLNGDTPTQYAVEQATRMLVQNGYPLGSEVMMITDGQPYVKSCRAGSIGSTKD